MAGEKSSKPDSDMEENTQGSTTVRQGTKENWDTHEVIRETGHNYAE